MTFEYWYENDADGELPQGTLLGNYIVVYWVSVTGRGTCPFLSNLVFFVMVSVSHVVFSISIMSCVVCFFVIFSVFHVFSI